MNKEKERLKRANEVLQSKNKILELEIQVLRIRIDVQAMEFKLPKSKTGATTEAIK